MNDPIPEVKYFRTKDGEFALVGEQVYKILPVAAEGSFYPIITPPWAKYWCLPQDTNHKFPRCWSPEPYHNWGFVCNEKDIPKVFDGEITYEES